MADRAGNQALRPLVRMALVLASVALATSACSSGSALTASTATTPSGPSSPAGGGTAGSGFLGSGSGQGSGSGSGGPSVGNGPTATGSPGTGSTTTGGSNAARAAGGKGKKSNEGRGGTLVTTTTIGIPPLRQQFTADNATFLSAMSSARTSLDGQPATTTPQKVAVELLPLLAAANAFQSQIVNLPWSSSAKPLAQSLTESVGQLTAVLEQIQRPGAFFSVRQLRTALASAEASVRSASTAVRTQLRLS